MTGRLVRELAIAAVAVAGCSDPPDRCARLAARLMPDPDQDFVETCRAASANDASYERMLDCLLAIEGDLSDEAIASCPGSDQLPLYFHF
jgi:hypothetical protein